MRATSTLALLPLALLPAACDPAASLLTPHGEPGGAEASLGWIFTALMVVVLLVVTVLLLVGLFRRREPADPHAVAREGGGIGWIMAGGVIAPAVILLILFVLVLAALSRSAHPTGAVLDESYEVIGHRWWWEVRQVDATGRPLLVTANELHIPVGTAVRIRLTSADVIHSFWVPQLAGKTDAIPGQVNQAWLRADSAGIYAARCAEYCGLQHAHMELRVVAEPPAAYAQWRDRQAADARPPRTVLEQRGLAVFLAGPCASCHQVRGTGASAIVGPDLTHVGSRLTLGAGTVPNNAGHLAGWIADAQGIKPGNQMPALSLPADQLQALVAYLGSLR